jgi:hypothetical protein
MPSSVIIVAVVENSILTLFSLRRTDQARRPRELDQGNKAYNYNKAEKGKPKSKQSSLFVLLKSGFEPFNQSPLIN